MYRMDKICLELATYEEFATALAAPPLDKGNEDSGNEIESDGDARRLV